MEKKISYLNRNFSDYRNSLINFTKEYYPDLEDTFNDASVGSWIIDLMAAVSDNLSYLADRVYQETSVNSAQQMSSLMNLARSKGLKVPGPKASVAEVELSCVLPVKNGGDASGQRVPDWDYAPILKKGMQFAAGSHIFELMDDVDFSHQFDNNAFSDRTFVPTRNSNGAVVSYKVTKRAVVASGKSKIYKKVLWDSDIVPFMEFIIPDKDVMNVESIIFKDGTDFLSDPDVTEFYFGSEFTPASSNTFGKTDVYRYFEVDSLSDQSRWGDVLKADGVPTVYEYRYKGLDSSTTQNSFFVTKGAWIPLKQKFITEFTDNGYLKVIFGSGTEAGQKVSMDGASDIGKYQISKLVNNDSLGVLPRGKMTMYIRYRVGGGAETNVAEGAINTITYYDVQFGCEAGDRSLLEAVKRTLTVYNVIPSVSGKDMPSEAEVRNLIKYNNGAQNRCVTVKDYYERILKLPPRYGTPFRVGVLEENNKIRVNLLGIDSDRKLSAVLPDVLVNNIQEYLREYKMVTDYVEVHSGKIINITVEADIYIDKDHNRAAVIKQVIDTIYDYMDVEKHIMGEDIYVSDIIKEIMKVDGVVNVFDLRIFNVYNGKYSLTKSDLPRYEDYTCGLEKEFITPDEDTGKFMIDIDSLDGILYSNSDSMFEIKFKEDISVRARER